MPHDHFDTTDEKGEPKKKGSDEISPRKITDLEALETEQETVTDDSVVYARGGGDVARPFAVADYASATEAIHAARDHLKAGSGGTIKLSATEYRLDGPVVIDGDGIIIEGEQPREQSSAADSSSPQDDVQTLGGTKLTQTASGAANVVQFRHDDDDAILFDVGICNCVLTWSDTLQQSDTGHGVFATEAPNIGRAIQGGIFENLRVFGHEGDKYGFNFEHCQSLTTDQLRVEGAGGGMRIYSDGTAIGNSSHGYVYTMLKSGTGSADAYRIEGNVNYSQFHHLQYNTIGFSGETRSGGGFVISPNGNVNDVWFGILDVEEIQGSTSGKTIGKITNFTSLGQGLANPLGQTFVRDKRLTYLRNGDNLNFDAIVSLDGTDPTTTNSQKKIWYRTVAGDLNFHQTSGTRPNPISAANTQGLSNFNGGTPLQWAQGYIRLPSTSYTAGTPVTFYTYWDRIDNGRDGLEYELYTDNGTNLAATIATENNHDTTNGEMQIVVYPHESTTMTFDVRLTVRGSN